MHRFAACRGQTRALRDNTFLPWIFAVLTAGFVTGCTSAPKAISDAALRERILPPLEIWTMPAPQPPNEGPVIHPPVDIETVGRAGRVNAPVSVPLRLPENAPVSLPENRDVEENRGIDAPRAPEPIEESFANALTLSEAIDLAYQNNPRLRVAQEAMEQARGGRQAAFAPFLPTVIGSYRYVASPSELEGFAGSDVPFVVNFGSNGVQEFQLTELRLQWTVWDFGRTPGRYQQASLRTEIAGLQYDRARQTIAFDVTAAYFRVLQARATRTIEEQAERRAEAFLKDTKNLFERGVVDRNDVLRADVQLAEVRQALVSARSAEAVALASLNLAMGLNVNRSPDVAEQAQEPAFDLPLAECLQLAADNRREFDVAQKSIGIAEQGVRTVKADFLPRVFVRGVASFIEASGAGDQNVQVGGFHIETNLYDGGRRRGELRAARSSMRASTATAQQICDTIAFEVNQSFRAVEDARERIALTKTALVQARENLRLLLNKYRAGAATPTDVIDGETTLTRAQQNALAALYDYQTALARLAYAMGLTPADGMWGRLPTCR